MYIYKYIYIYIYITDRKIPHNFVHRLLYGKQKQKTYKLSKLFNERLHTKSLKYSTLTTGKYCKNSNFTLSRDAVNVI